MDFKFDLFEMMFLCGICTQVGNLACANRLFSWPLLVIKHTCRSKKISFYEHIELCFLPYFDVVQFSLLLSFFYFFVLTLNGAYIRFLL